MALRIKSEGSLKSTRHWSCSTLRDGVDQLVCESRECDQQEEDLLKMIQDWYIETGVTLDSNRVHNDFTIQGVGVCICLSRLKQEMELEEQARQPQEPEEATPEEPYLNPNRTYK